MAKYHSASKYQENGQIALAINIINANIKICLAIGGLFFFISKSYCQSLTGAGSIDTGSKKINMNNNSINLPDFKIIDSKYILSENSVYAFFSEEAYNDELYQSTLLSGSGSLSENAPIELQMYLKNSKSYFPRDPKKDGPFAAVSFESDDEIIVSIRGTDGIIDIFNDIQLLTKTQNQQYVSALKYLNTIIKNSNGKKITITGHSLGGSVAQLLGAAVGYKVVTFNSAPIVVSSKDIGISEKTLDERNIINIRRKGDPLSDILDKAFKTKFGEFIYDKKYSYGKDYTVDLGTCIGVACKHKISLIADEAEKLRNNRDSIIEKYVELKYAFSGSVEDRIAEIKTAIAETAPDKPVLITGPTASWKGMWAAADASPLSTFLMSDGVRRVTPGKEHLPPYLLLEDINGEIDILAVKSASPGFAYSHWGEWTGEEGKALWVYNSGIDQNAKIDHLHWVIGDPSPKSAFQGRSGSAYFGGTLKGDFAPNGGNVTMLNAVTGQVHIGIDFASQNIEGELSIDVNGNRWEEASLSASLLSSTSNGLRFFGQLYGPNGNGGMNGQFYGSQAQEVGGTFHYFGDGGGASGVFLAKEMEAPENANVFIGLSTQTDDHQIDDSGNMLDFNPAYVGTGVKIPVYNGGEVAATEKFDIGNYSYANWGRWEATNLTPPRYQSGGYWVSGEKTPATVIAMRTGTATYKGQMRGDFVPHSGTREGAYGLIELNANFNNDRMTGQMQWGHGGAGTVTGGPVSPVVQLEAAISSDGRFFQSSDGNTNGTGIGYGFWGTFLGPYGNELGGASWLVDSDGSYNGVFVAKEQ